MKQSRSFFNAPNIVEITPEKAKFFGLVLENKKEIKSIRIIFDSVKERAGNIQIKLRLSENSGNFIEKEVAYKKSKISPVNSLFVGLAYLNLPNLKTSQKEKAKKHIQSAEINDIDSCLPYYLYIKYDLKKYEELEDDEKERLFAAFDKDDVFPDFFTNIFYHEKNKFRSIGIAKRGWNKFPSSLEISFRYAKHLFDEDEVERCIEVLERPLKADTDARFYEYRGSVEVLFDCYCKLNKFKEAESLIKSSRSKNEDKKFFLGILNFRQAKYEEAARFFVSIVEDDCRDSDVSVASTYFLLGCYQKLHNINKLQEIITLIPEKEHEFYIIPYQLKIDEIEEEILIDCLKENLDEISAAKLKGLLGALYENSLPNISSPDQRKILTKEEKKKSIEAQKLLEEALALYPNVRHFIRAYSNILYYNKEYEKSYLFSLKTYGHVEEHVWSDTQISLADCTDEFQNNIADFVENNLPSSEGENYFNSKFDEDIQVLWKNKKYDQIAKMYEHFENLFDFSKIKENVELMGDYYEGNSLFEIAYSLDTEKNQRTAKYLYEKYLEIVGKSSAALNNLAVIYEKEKNMKKARSLIKEAKKIALDKDEIINRNYERLILHSKNESSSQTSATKRSTPKNKRVIPIFDLGSGKILLGERECEIPRGTIEYYICKSLFSKPFGERVEEGVILEDWDRMKGKQEHSRTIYDAHRRINTKLKETLGIIDLIEYGNASIWIRKEIFTNN